MSKIVAVRKNSDGSIGEYKLDTGEVLNVEDAVLKTNLGEIDGCSTFTTRDGHESIRSDRGQYNYSLSNLPEF